MYNLMLSKVMKGNACRHGNGAGLTYFQCLSEYFFFLYLPKVLAGFGVPRSFQPVMSP